MSFAEQRSLSGNGMVLPQVAAWWLYIFSHTVRRELLERMAPPMPSAADELEADLRALGGSTT